MLAWSTWITHAWSTAQWACTVASRTRWPRTPESGKPFDAPAFDIATSNRAIATQLPMPLTVGGADQSENVLMGDRKDDAPVEVLKDIGVIVLEQARHHDVAALDQSQMPGRQRLTVRRLRGVEQELLRSRPRCVHQGPGAHRARSPSPFKRGRPTVRVTCAWTQRVCVKTCVPRRRAPTALSTTSRASSTHPSE